MDSRYDLDRSSIREGIIRAWRTAARVAALVVAAGGLWFGWQFLLSGTVGGRTLISPMEIRHGDGFRYIWRVPVKLRASPWYRAEVRMWEDGNPLPFRVESPDAVATEGKGRFGVAPFSAGTAQKETLWFSASDNTDPSGNSRHYELEVREPAYRMLAGSGACVTVAVILALIALPPRIWSRIAQVFAKPGIQRITLLRWGAALILIFSLAVLAQSWSWTRIVVPAGLPAGRLILESSNAFSCRLPRWVLPMNLEFGYMLEDGKAMERISESAWWSASTAGNYCHVPGTPARIRFRPSDDTNACSGTHKYVFAVPIFPVWLALRLSVLLGSLGLLLYLYSADIGNGRLLLMSGPRWRDLRSRSVRWFQRSGWLLGMLAVAIAKVWAVAGAEVRAEVYDAHGYVRAALSPAKLLWGPIWDAMPSHPPGFPFLAALLGQFGVPWRLGIEILFLFACGGLAMATASLLRLRLAPVVMFAAMAWHPWTFRGFCAFMADPIVLLAIVALLAIMFRVLRQSSCQWNWWPFLGMGLVLFLWEWSRTEDPLVYGAYALFAVLAWVLARREVNPAPPRRCATLLALPVLVVLVLSTGVGLLNYRHYGIYAKSKMSSPGLMELMKALYRIKPTREFRFVAVTRQSLEAACRVSPSLRPFQTKLLDPNDPHATWGLRNGAPGEFGPMLNFHLLECVPGDDRTAHDIMFASASEINAALRDGRLPQRRVLFPFDPNVSAWLKNVPACFVSQLRLVAGTERSSLISEHPSEDFGIHDDFDAAAHRRTVSAYPHVLLGSGWIRCGLGALDSVAVIGSSGALMAASALSTTNRVDDTYAFSMRCPLPRGSDTLSLAFFRAGHQQFCDLGHDAKWWATNWSPVEKTAVLPESKAQVAYSYRLSVREALKEDRLVVWESRAEKICKALLCSVLLSAFVTGMFAPTWGKHRLLKVLACLALVAGWLVGRAALYGIFVANTGFQADRYMRCVSPLFIVVLLLVGAITGAALQGLIRKQGGAGAAHTTNTGAHDSSESLTGCQDATDR